MAERPNILFFHVDNLGFGELSCYSGGPFRGTWTRRIDAFRASVQREAPVPAGAPLSYRPAAGGSVPGVIRPDS
jgi:hypothetical protein